MRTLRIGTRGSELALFQANAVAELLRQRAGATCEIEIIKTAGDGLAEAPIADIGGKRLFVKEIEDALLAGAIDVAVHSSKDMSALLPDGLAIGAVLAREDPRDAIVLPRGRSPVLTDTAPLGELIHHLGAAPRIGTGSVRRTAQLATVMPGARFSVVRGNLGTRLRKLDDGGFDALVLAAAGLRRLGEHARISAVLPPHVCVPAPGQGIIAVEVRSRDPDVRAAVERINDAESAAALAAERAVVVRLGGGCQMPLGAHATISIGRIAVTAIVITTDGVHAARADAEGPVADAGGVGAVAAELLLARGAGEILAGIERARAAVEGLQP